MTTFISGQRCFFDLHYTVNNDDLMVNKQFRMILKSLNLGIIFSKQEFSVTDSNQQETFAVYVDIPDSIQAREITVIVLLEELKNDVWIRACYQQY